MAGGRIAWLHIAWEIRPRTRPQVVGGGIPIALPWVTAVRAWISGARRHRRIHGSLLRTSALGRLSAILPIRLGGLCGLPILLSRPVVALRPSLLRRPRRLRPRSGIALLRRPLLTPFLVRSAVLLAVRPGNRQTHGQGRGSQSCVAELSRVIHPDHVPLGPLPFEWFNANRKPLVRGPS